jgi:hypothetical protein
MDTEAGKLDLEKQKLHIEKERLELEKLKILHEDSRIKWTAISVLVSLLAALATVVFGFWSTNQQAKSNFKVELMKTIMTPDSISESVRRARFLAFMFKDFNDNLANFENAHKSEEKWQNYNVDISKRKEELIRIMAPQGLCANQVLALWNELFGEDWTKRNELFQIVSTAKCPPN